jgi:flagellar M-ring protein FliF
MPGNRPNFVSQLTEMWARLTWPQRLTIAISGVLGLALVGTIVFLMNRVEYEPLYRDLNPEDAQAIASKLKEQKKDYMVQGTSIMVAASKNEIDKLRLEIAGSGLARSGRIGYEIFDKNQFGMTDFTEQVNLQRALEGELSRTISSLSEISQARVHIVLPKDSIFEEKKEDAKASVVVSLKRGAELSKSSVSGIKGVVAGAVPGLHTYNVSIVDDEGRLLSQSVESGDSARSEMESGIREQYEKEMSGKVVSILEPLVGKGKVHANASIELDFNTTEQMEETYNPNPPAVLSQQKSEERSGGPASANAGIPGTASNTGQASSSTLNTIPERVRQSETTNYEVNKLVRHTVQPKGTVHRLSVAVILDHKSVWSKTKDGTVSERSEPRSPQDVQAYRELVLAAVGYNKDRGDVVTIENVPFYSDSKPEEAQPKVPWYTRIYSQPSYVLPAIKYGSFIVLFLMAYLVLFRPVHKRVFQAISVAAVGPGGQELQESSEGARALASGKPAEELAAGAGGAVASLPEAEPNVDAIAALESVSDEQIERELLREASQVDMDGRKYAVMKKKLVEKSRKDPEMISQLIRTLLREKA